MRLSSRTAPKQFKNSIIKNLLFQDYSPELSQKNLILLLANVSNANISKKVEKRKFFVKKKTRPTIKVSLEIIKVTLEIPSNIWPLTTQIY